MRRNTHWSAVIAIVSLLGCSEPGPETKPAEHQAVAIADQEDAVCGMLVRDQSAPRGQVVHGDGSRLFFCSLGDLLVHLGAPSPHGRTEAVFVEVMELAEDPARSHTGPHRWVAADAARYVVGVPRNGIMGEPVLAYADEATAEEARRRYEGTKILNLAGLQRWWSERARQ